MCRLLGIASSEPTDFKIVLREAPRSLAALSREHRDGWGIAVFDDRREAGGSTRAIACASEDERFHRLAIGSRGEVLISHVRQKTVGETSLANTHPFQRGRWIFAHNGTVKDIRWLRSQTSPGARSRGARRDGQRTPVLLASHACLDEAGLAHSLATPDTDHAIGAACGQARARPNFGAYNFLLSDGVTLYAHRFGGRCTCSSAARTTWCARAEPRRHGGRTPWSQRRTALFVASEKITDEPWQAIEDGTLLRIERSPTPYWHLVAA